MQWINFRCSMCVSLVRCSSIVFLIISQLFVYTIVTWVMTSEIAEVYDWYNQGNNYGLFTYFRLFFYDFLAHGGTQKFFFDYWWTYTFFLVIKGWISDIWKKNMDFFSRIAIAILIGYRYKEEEERQNWWKKIHQQ